MLNVQRIHWPWLFAVATTLGCASEQGPSADSSPSESRPQAEGLTRFQFTDVSAQTEVDSTYHNGEESGTRSIVESLGGGVGIFDYDKDGRPDLLFPRGGELAPGQPLTGMETHLWRQVGSFEFSQIAEEAWLAPPRTLTHGCTCADFDNDGFTDILITGYAGVQLFRNLGDGTFYDCTPETGLSVDELWSTSASWVDIDRDGDLDLYVTHYVDWSWDNHPECFAAQSGVRDVCSPNEFNALPDSLFINQGNGLFTDESIERGLEDGGKGLGVVAAHLDQDQWIDVYVANDTVNNYLYVNDESGMLRDAGLIRGVAVDSQGTPNGSMGIAVFDFDNDRHSDIWVTNYENETCALYQGDGRGSFLWGTDRAGVNALGTLYVGFGTVAGDFDLDGDQDVAVTNGHVILHPKKSNLAQEPLLLNNTTHSTGSQPQSRLIKQTFDDEDYFSKKHRGRGLVAADLDLDGDLDLVFSHLNEPAVVLRNDSPRHGESLSVELIGRDSNRNAIGTRVTLTTDQGAYIRQLIGGGSYLSQAPYSLHWAIPNGERFEKLQITWPDGGSQTLTSLSPGTNHQIIEPRKQP